MTDQQLPEQNFTRVTLVKKSHIFGQLAVGAVYSFPVPSDDHVEAYRKLRRDFPDENPMDWERCSS